MDSPIRQHVLRRLGAISVAVGAGCTTPSAELLRVPVDIVADLVDESESSTWGSEDKSSLLKLLAADPRAAVRARVAESAGALSGSARDAAERLLKELASDAAVDVRWGAARGLARLLEGASAFDRLKTLSDWTTSERGAERAAMAAALGFVPQMLGADLALGALAGDAEPEVRRRVARALAARFHEHREHYTRLAGELARDVDPRTRRAARRALRPSA